MPSPPLVLVEVEQQREGGTDVALGRLAGLPLPRLGALVRTLSPTMRAISWACGANAAWSQTLKLTRTDAQLGVMAAALVMVVTIPLLGRLSDKIGRTRIYFWGSPLTGLSAFAGFWLMKHSGGDILLVWLEIIIPFGVFYAAIYGPEATLFAELFDAKILYSGISFVYQFSGIFANGITPIIATYLLQKGEGEPWMICVYVLFSGVVNALSAAWIGRKAHALQQLRPSLACS
ncbi:MFS transporter [Pseudogulbenkiania sp. MAI-1]|uniref:MFS transporter n=1 Tax=Pseudogulbenkiania sp. MAI-1 TaxID=990370 RepID=UPI0009FFCB6C|nr:MFS transporter [Pseudogulbenkiania sp. MAI-1]